MATNEETEFQGRIQRIEALIRDVERSADPAARARTQEIVQSLLDFHGTGLAKLLDHVAQAGEPGLAIIDAISRDDLVGSMLLLYGLHPLDTEARVRRALEQVRPMLHSHGGNVELLGVSEGAVRLRMLGSCHGCPSSALTLRNAIEEAIFAAAPEVTALDVEGVVDGPAPPPAGFIPLERLLVEDRPPGLVGR